MRILDGYVLAKLAKCLVDKFDNVPRMLRKTGLNVDDRTLKRMLNGRSVRQRGAEDLVELANVHLTPRELHNCRVPESPLYAITRPYDQNMKDGPPRRNDAIAASDLQRSPVDLWGRQIASCFGAASAPWTSTLPWALEMERRSCDIITMGSFRSRKREVYRPSSNFAFPIEPALPFQALDGVDDLAQIEVQQNDDHIDPREPMTMFNVHGSPSPPPESWLRSIADTRSRLRSTTALIVSLLPSHENGGGNPRECFLKDTKDVVSMVVNTLDVRNLPDAIELNLSYPTEEGVWAQVYLDPDLVAEACRRAREVVDESGSEIKLVAKAGPMSEREARAFVAASAPFVDGFSLINAVRTPAVRNLGRNVLQPFFGPKFKLAAMTGAAIRQVSLDTVRHVVAALESQGISGKKILAMGGVSEPQHVDEFRSRGAHCVQAATVLYQRPNFGALIRQHLSGNGAIDPSDPTTWTQEHRDQWIGQELTGALDDPVLLAFSTDGKGAAKSGASTLETMRLYISRIATRARSPKSSFEPEQDDTTLWEDNNDDNHHVNGNEITTD